MRKCMFLRIALMQQFITWRWSMLLDRAIKGRRGSCLGFVTRILSYALASWQIGASLLLVLQDYWGAMTTLPQQQQSAANLSLSVNFYTVVTLCCPDELPLSPWQLSQSPLKRYPVFIYDEFSRTVRTDFLVQHHYPFAWQRSRKELVCAGNHQALQSNKFHYYNENPKTWKQYTELPWLILLCRHT